MTGSNEPDESNEQPSPEPTCYATVSFTVPPESEAALLGANDTLAPTNGGDAFDVTDVYRSFEPGGSVHVVARVSYAGEPTVDGRRLYGGDETNLSTGSYRVDADVLAINQTGTTIPTRRVPVVLAVNASEPVARSLEPGQRAQIGDDTVATIESVTRRTRDDETRLLVGVELRAWERAGVVAFDGRALRIGNRVTLVTDEVVVRGRVYELGTTSPEE